MSALSIRNMNWTVGQMEQINDVTAKVSDERRAEIKDEIAMGLERDRANYWAASVTLNWSACSLILNMMAEGTDNSPIISGGEILELGTINSTEQIPF